jgi:hypothetical protein
MSPKEPPPILRPNLYMDAAGYIRPHVRSSLGASEDAECFNIVDVNKLLHAKGNLARLAHLNFPAMRMSIATGRIAQAGTVDGLTTTRRSHQAYGVRRVRRAATIGRVRTPKQPREQAQLWTRDVCTSRCARLVQSVDLPQCASALFRWPRFGNARNRAVFTVGWP